MTPVKTTSEVSDSLPEAMAVVPEVTAVKLTEQQQTAFEALVAYLTDPTHENDYFVLQGYAGTGKTFLITEVIKHILKNSGSKSVTVAMTAPTNKAVKVLSKRPIKEGSRDVMYRTLHSLLGLRPVINEVTGVQEFKKDPMIQGSIDEVNILIVDEASMLNTVLFRYIDENKHSALKVIFMGDPFQIPPVQSKDDGEDDLGVYNNKNKYQSIPMDPKQREKYNMGCVSLTQIVRQAEANPIIELSLGIRKASKRLKFDIQDVDLSGIEIIQNKAEFHAVIDKLYLSNTFKQDSNYVHLVAYTNRTVDAMNKVIRSRIFQGTKLPKFMVGDLLNVDKPVKDNLGRPTLNQNEELKVTKVEVKEQDFMTNLGVTHLKYYELTCIVVDSNNKKEHVLTAVHEDSEADYNKRVKELLAQAKKVKGSAWASYYAFVETFAALKHGYAITAHKSQGSTYQNAIVVYSDIMEAFSAEEANRILYTAITRPSDKLYLML